MGSIADHDHHKEVDTELLPYIRVYKDGSVERLMGSPTVPPSLNDPETGVSSKDIIISQTPLVSARISLPNHVSPNKKLPILLYFHGGAFIFESPFSFLETKFMNHLVAEARVIAVSVDYRLAPEHLLPCAYDDCWTALRWVASNSTDTSGIEPDPWLLNHANFERLFIGGDSAGANIAHNIAMRAGCEKLPGGVKVLGAFITHPYLWGWKPVGEERKEGLEQKLPYLLWKFLYPTAPCGIDCAMINPHGEGAPSLAGLGCSRLLVTTTDMDGLRHRAFAYYNGVKESGWEGEAELVVVEGEPHGFHTCNYESESAKKMIKRLASFLLK